MSTAITPKQLSALVQRQLPEFMTGEYDEFIQFLKAYYEFMEQDAGAQKTLQEFRYYKDIDLTIDQFVDRFIKQFAENLPKSILNFTNDPVESKRSVAKYLTTLNRSKGNEQSYRLLFRLMFGEDIEFLYPGEQLLRPSDGKWTRDKTLKCTKQTSDDDLFKLQGFGITGQTSGATAVVEQVQNYTQSSIDVYELFLNSDSIEGTFIEGEVVSGDVSSDTINGVVKAVLSEITITGAGLGYTVGERLTVEEPASGEAAQIEIAAVSDAGAIRRVKITNFGIGYESTPNVTIGNGNSTTNVTYTITSNVASLSYPMNHELAIGANVTIDILDGTGVDGTYTILSTPNKRLAKVAMVAANGTGNATVTNLNPATFPASIGAICNYDGYYIGVDGQLSENIKIQDSFYYQNFSYVIRASQSADKWREVVKKVLHPAGMQLFGEVRLISSDTVGLRNKRQPRATITLYLNMLREIIANANVGAGQSEYKVTLQIQPNILYSKVAASPSRGTFDEFKFKFQGNTAGGYTSLVIEDVGNLVIGPFCDTPNEQFNLTPPAYIELIT